MQGMADQRQRLVERIRGAVAETQTGFVKTTCAPANEITHRMQVIQ
jgi:hypothetical protein